MTDRARRVGAPRAPARPRWVLAIALGPIALAAAQGERGDGAVRLDVRTGGSLQNPAFSPDGRSLVATRFRDGYNEGAADLIVIDRASGEVTELVADGSANVNLPGSAWNRVTGRIVFSSSREPHDEIWSIASGDRAGRITNASDRMAYEPSWSPDGRSLVYESHPLDEEGEGVIRRLELESGVERPLTPSTADCRQPNWSPAGDRIVFQRRSPNGWDLWTVEPDGRGLTRITTSPGDETDASFSPDGLWIVYSSDQGEIELASLFVVPVTGGRARRLTHAAAYDGAPSWSPDGRDIVFESCPGDPDESAGTALWFLEVPER